MNLAKTVGLIAAATVAGTMSASAALIDFTDDSVGAGGGTTLGGYIVTGNPENPNTNEARVRGPIALSDGSSLAGDNDGLGIIDDEISSHGSLPQWVTITFANEVVLNAVYFLDLFVSDDHSDEERGIVTVGSVPSSVDASLEATAAHGTPGLGELTGLNFRGTSFTFSVAGGENDAVANPDAALAGIEVSAVPLPASILLLGAALGGLGAFGRRRKS